MTLVLRYAARSDRGLARSNNQDSVYAGPRLLALADGMGGHAAGEVASKVVIAALAPLDDDEPGEDLLSQLHEATLAGNQAIAELVAGDPDLDGMGTTLTAVLFASNKIGMVHIGDSRAYLRRNGQFSQITHDDTFVQSLIDEGRITEEEAATHPQRSLLLKALTGNDEVQPSLTIREARAGDRYLLCSDGLSGMVSDETIADAIQIPDPQQCADRMIELALKGGGLDNVTVVIADVVDVDYGEDAPIVGGAAGNGQDESSQGDSPAARASAITAPKPDPVRIEAAEERPDPRVKRRKRIRIAVWTLVVLVVLAAGLLVTRFLVNQQYYVSEGTDGEVTIFQGVRGSFLGIDLHSQVQGSCPPDNAACGKLFVRDLNPALADQVRTGSDYFENLKKAQDHIGTLRQRNSGNETPPTQTPTPEPPPTGQPTTGGGLPQPNPQPNPLPTGETPPQFGEPGTGG
ncbi:protein phosphatase [Herbihabitans rhizosphaerae]|uniref:Serine/threonine protein phosphatase PstP n=1 Tax=Herbihabitans rhizosphaerae TaxID=1872711 RepID=A0A4Q7KLY0_9PSEU|nr:PP2C family serine/threonine-protein phosphatase [Herbihabitans rhizosphaerae]RZS37535.1 protein phosphatase [Herbihabitans rhizosphaerae]